VSVISNFERRVEGAVDGAAAAMFASPIEPAQIAKKAEKQMKREKLVGSGRQYAPTLYNVLVNERDDKRLFGFYPTLSSEIENYLYAKGTEAGMEFDSRPLVRFIPDPGLKKGRFDVIAEVVAAPIIKKLRNEEQEYYGLAPKNPTPPEAASMPHAHSVGRAGNQMSQQNNAPHRGGSAPHSLDNRFAGFDVPVNINADTPDSSSLLPLSQGRSSRDAEAQLSPRNVTPAQSPLTDSATYASGAEPETLSVIGNASLFNSAEQRTYRLEHRKITLGRGKENHILVADANASRVHARFSQDATGRWKVTDLGSTNGTQLNGRSITSAILKSGDQVTIGMTIFQFME